MRLRPVGVAVAEERSVGTVVDDFTINVAVNESLFNFNESLFQDVSVDVTEGRVLLTGKVPEPDDRVDAVRLAWQADGVKEVINEIQVTDTGGIESYLTDVRISNELRADLLFDGGVSSINYNVETVRRHRLPVGHRPESGGTRPGDRPRAHHFRRQGSDQSRTDQERLT